MSDGWGKFWGAISLIVLSAALFSNLQFDSAINLGPMSTWIAALATFCAVVVALKNTEKTLNDAVKRDFATKSMKDVRYYKSVAAISYRLIRVIQSYWKDHVDEDPDKKWTEEELKFMKRSMRMSLNLDLLHKMPLHDAPDIDAILAIDMLITVATHVERNIDDHIELAAVGPVKSFKIDLGDDLQSAEWAVELMNSRLKSLELSWN